MQDIVNKLETIYVDLTEALKSARAVAKATAKGSKVPAKEEDFFTHPWKLKRQHRPAFGKKYISCEEILAGWIAEWKAEGRLSANGRKVRIGKKEAEILGLEEESVVNIYDVTVRCMDLFSEN